MNIKESAYKSISNFKSRLEEEKFLISSISEKEYNYEFEVSISRIKLKVQVYFGKKGVKTIIQGDTKSDEYKILQNVIMDQPALDFRESKLIEPEEYIGSDECGKGDFFGPLVTAAVHVDKQIQIKLKQAGVRDSKDLSEIQIGDLAAVIKKNISGNFEIIKITPAKYNELYEKFKNLNKLLNWAHSKAIDNLLAKTGCKTVITDKFSNKDLNVISNTNHSSVNFIQETGAEKYVGVAAASILARDEFNQWFIQQKKLGYNLLKGSSDAVTDSASKLLSVIGDNDIGNFVKLHFKTFQKINRKRL